ncbi:MAG: aminoacyl-tRNA hydrolase [Phycisphaerales bacterium]|nr:aminoacyl-tRNA hydrolase [Phycisphaerales bacterium]
MADLELAPNVVIDDACIDWTYLRASGPGGQNVNKRSTKAQMRITLASIPLSDRAAAKLRDLAGPWLTNDDELVMSSDEHRTQAKNRDACLEKLRALIVQATHVPKPRKKTKPSRGAVQRRIDEKKRRGDIKKQRRNLDD